MLRISENVANAFAQASEDSFRRRALAYAGAGNDPARHAWLVPIFEYSEAMAGHYDMQAEQSRLAMFVLAYRAGPKVLERGDIAAILDQKEAPEHVRRRLLIDHLKAIA